MLYLNETEPIWFLLHMYYIEIFDKKHSKFKTAIISEFSGKIGLADLMLGIKLTHGSSPITLLKSHHNYFLLDFCGMLDWKPLEIPMIPNSDMEAALDLESENFL
ncbi:hypothetical protein O181_077245 [Austropuccinia psidii MF-1]|uniref:Uncharacterized protein n=1 Tax=Austropuccinia psidii MF-1 TaxID=1389203 RepID=A0A9Q3FHL9_9BASI|nr:hypothetical protein [Austropuccinia psidii MF-1]